MFILNLKEFKFLIKETINYMFTVFMQGQNF